MSIIILDRELPSKGATSPSRCRVWTAVDPDSRHIKCRHLFEDLRAVVFHYTTEMQHIKRAALETQEGQLVAVALAREPAYWRIHLVVLLKHVYGQMLWRHVVGQSLMLNKSKMSA